MAPHPTSGVSTYVGRFAPSPTGPLHFGSLITAVGSYLQTRSQAGLWRVRIEDLDPPREQPGAAANILRTLEAYGFRWDGEVIYQSRRTAAYRAALGTLIRARSAYYCNCSRKQVEADGQPGAFGMIYSGACRDRKWARGHGRSLRVVTHDQPIRFEDENFGSYRQCVESEIGDFIICRADGYIAYHLAVVIDDAEQGVTQVVRGADLLDTTPRHIYLQQLLRLPTPGYLHLPVAINRQGFKLSKQTRARALPLSDPRPYLVAALKFLNYQPPAEVRAARLDDAWRWAIAHWSSSRLPKARTIESRDNESSLR